VNIYTIIILVIVGLALIANLVQELTKRSGLRQMEMFKLLIENQQKTSQSVINAVDSISVASSKQAEVLGKYLDLFKSPDDPRHWTEQPEQENLDELIKLGFPKEASEADQAKWILDHLGEI